MSKAKSEKSQRIPNQGQKQQQQQQHNSANNNNNNKKKQRDRKFWFEEKVKKKRPPPPETVEHVEPPKDAQQFSANWKSLQQILKASEPKKKPSESSSGQSRARVQKRVRENVSGTSAAGPTQTDCDGKGKQKAAPNDAAVKDTPAVMSPPGRSSAPKRKSSGGTLSQQEVKRKKTTTTVEEAKKPTEKDLWFDDVDPDDIEATLGREAADIMRKKQSVHSRDTESALVKENAFEGLTRAVAIDCEMVGVGPDGEDSILARVSLVNQFGKCIYDKYVRPTEKVTDYRTAVSGIRPQDIAGGEEVSVVQREVAEILGGRIVVGHAIHNDLKILLLDHPKKKIRDTQKYKPFKKTVKSGRPSLKLLCREILNVKVQQGEHSSVQDAQATMRLYTLVKKKWEAEIKASHHIKDSAPKGEKRKPKIRGRKPRGF